MTTKGKFTYYTNGEKTIKVYDNEIPPIGYYPGNNWNRVSWNKGLTKDTDERVLKNTTNTHDTRMKNGSYIPWNKGLTKDTDSRIVGMSGENNPMYGKHPKAWNKGLTKETNEIVKSMSDNHKGSVPWNKGLTKDEDSRIVSQSRSEETKEKIRKTHLTPEVQFKRFSTMQTNGTLGHNQDTKAELDVYNELVNQYGKDDIIHPYIDKNRYPFKCDFYIKSEDLFIEVHGNWTHGGKPFDPNDEECQKQLKNWEEKAKTSNYYKNAIYTWTNLDVRKLQIAKQNKLNFRVIYYKY